jgi:hypothetical protein
MRLLHVLVAALVALTFAGCSGSNRSGANSAGGSDNPGAGASDEVGALQGSVFDDERRPINEANVALHPLGKNASTDLNGRFVFRQIPVGDYKLVVTKGGYHDRAFNASVAPRRTTSVLLTLEPLPTDVSYHLTFPFTGHQQCMLYTNVGVWPCSYPYLAAKGEAASRGLNLSQYGAPRDVLNNNYRYNFSAAADHTGIVSELLWKPQSDAAKYYVLQLSCAWYDAKIDDCVPPGTTGFTADATFARARGVNPLRIEWKQDTHPKWLPWIMSRAYLSGPADRPAGAALDQKVEMFNTVFYGAPVPRDWTILTGGPAS